ncbi:hypothetical protein HYC85_020620 [Camellia sinensis]|uniref:Uncharacterized protein n=1 Tax=Camellia sinensis TaxID=4442 RepID=A0A7J7GU67_CAMSI|nr:hypothetical protein HYC85_020620 [Camellia sinensis]
MPETYVVHLGNSKELMEVAENSVAKRILREHVRESLRVQNEDLLFAAINSVSCGKGQDLFLRSFHESLQLIQEKKLQVPSLHVVIVGSDMNAQTKFETELRSRTIGAQETYWTYGLFFPTLSEVDISPTAVCGLMAVWKQHIIRASAVSARGECFGRITIEVMSFQQPVLIIPFDSDCCDCTLKQF